MAKRSLMLSSPFTVALTSCKFAYDLHSKQQKSAAVNQKTGHKNCTQVQL